MKYRIFVPKNLILENIIPEKYKHLKSKKHLQRMYWFVEMVCVRGMTHGRDHDLWAKLHWKYLENMFTRRYLEYKKLLIDCDVILVNKTYSVGRFSQNYRIAPLYEHGYRTVSVDDAVLIKKLKKRNRHKLTAKGNIYEYLYACLKQTSIDDSHFGELNIHHAKVVDWIKNKKVYLHVDTYGRTHTNITTLKRSHRKQLMINGEKLTQIDIKNCQPLLLNLLVDKLINKNYIKNNQDVLEYRKLTEMGVFYNHCSELYKINESDKKNIKNRLFKNVFFGRKTAKKFAKYFPTISDAIQFYKKDDYKNLARELQKIESDIFIHKICKRIMSENPDVQILTVHDCILAQDKHAEYIASVIQDEFFKLNLNVAVEISR
jgi:hypothetical protein